MNACQDVIKAEEHTRQRKKLTANEFHVMSSLVLKLQSLPLTKLFSLPFCLPSFFISFLFGGKRFSVFRSVDLAIIKLGFLAFTETEREMGSPKKEQSNGFFAAMNSGLSVFSNAMHRSVGGLAFSLFLIIQSFTSFLLLWRLTLGVIENPNCALSL